MIRIYTLLFFILPLFYSTALMGQVGIGTSTPDPSAILQVESTNKGVLPPQVSLVSVNDNTTIVNPAKGLVVMNTAGTLDGSGLYINTGTTTSPQWEKYDSYDASALYLKVNKLIYRGTTVDVTKVMSTEFFEWRISTVNATTYVIQARLKAQPFAAVTITGSAIVWNTGFVVTAPINQSWNLDWSDWKTIYNTGAVSNNNWDTMMFLNISNDPTHFYKLGSHVIINNYNMLTLEIL